MDEVDMLIKAAEIEGVKVTEKDGKWWWSSPRNTIQIESIDPPSIGNFNTIIDMMKRQALSNA